MSKEENTGKEVMDQDVPEKNFLDVFNDTIDALESDAKSAGTNITAVCREAGVSRASPDRWKRRPPRTVQLVARMQDNIRAKKKQNAEAPQQ